MAGPYGHWLIGVEGRKSKEGCQRVENEVRRKAWLIG